MCPRHPGTRIDTIHSGKHPLLHSCKCATTPPQRLRIQYPSAFRLAATASCARVRTQVHAARLFCLPIKASCEGVLQRDLSELTQWALSNHDTHARTNTLCPFYHTPSPRTLCFCPTPLPCAATVNLYPPSDGLAAGEVEDTMFSI